MKSFMACLLLMPALAFAEATLSLDAAARSEVPNDEMVVSVAVEKKGADVGALNESVLAGLNAISSEAESIKGVNAQLANVNTSPVYADNAQTGWSVRGNIELRSKDMKALGKLSARLAKQYQIESMRFQLSQERRSREESALLKQAALNFRRKAEDAVGAFGYTGYEIKQLVLGSPEAVRPYQANERMVMAASVSALPLAKGTSDVVVNVSGSVLMK